MAFMSVHAALLAAALLAAALFLLEAAAASDEPSTATLEFRVKVPAGTPEAEALYLSGNLEPLGRWKPDGLRLERSKDGTYGARATLPRGRTLELKVTRGSWQTVERAADGSDIPNRELRVEGDAIVELEVARWDGSAAAAKRSTVTGVVREHPRFASRHLGNERTILVWLPPGYEKEAAARYPVLYLHDGQNVFDAATAFGGKEWKADEAADRLIREGRMRPIIMVAVHNAPDRIAEYTPWRDPKRDTGGKGDLHASFLIEELKSFIDREYRTLPGKEHTAVCGSSLGGLVSLHTAMRHPDAVSLCAALSPSLWWDGHRILADLEAGAAARLRGLKVWFDMGTREDGGGDGGGDEPVAAGPVADARKLADVLDAAGWVIGRDYYYWEAAGARHDEEVWAARFPRVLTFLFGKTPGAE